MLAIPRTRRRSVGPYVGPMTCDSRKVSGRRRLKRRHVIPCLMIELQTLTTTRDIILDDPVRNIIEFRLYSELLS